MVFLISTASRIYSGLFPPTITKNDSPLKFGILGAAKIAPMTLISPAKTHPDVVVQAVAARDRKRAEAFARKNGIPEVKDSYQEIIDDPSIDCVFIPLPNGLHYEWSVRALRAGKHVLLEKPSVSNEVEARKLFRLPQLSQPDGPVILEAFHYRFHPSWTLFLSFITPGDVVNAEAYGGAPHGVIAADDIRFKFDLAGGAIMDIGTYSLSYLRQVFASEPEECLECKVDIIPEPYDVRCDQAFSVTYRFPNNGIGIARGRLRGKYITPWPHITVEHKELVVDDDQLPDSQEKSRIRKVTLWMVPLQWAYHRIDVMDTYTILSKSDGMVVKKWTDKACHKAYTFKDAGLPQWPSEPFWTTYRHQLEQFVNRVRNRETSHWITPEDSIAQMRMIDMAYAKSGLPPRPTSSFD